MRLLTVTSDNYLISTRLLLESLRVWHPDVSVVVYALERGWTPEHAAALAPHGVRVELLPEPDPSHRGGALGQAVHCMWKLDVFAAQTEPFFFLDSDILILKPLDALWETTTREGWFCVHEGTALERYYTGQVTGFLTLPAAAVSRTSFNTGVLGCDPRRHRPVLELARDWSRRITANYHGDQGLLNLAWAHLHGDLPGGVSPLFNGGWHEDNRIDLAQTVLHFARPDYPLPGRCKHTDQALVWSAWPKGVRLVNLTDTDFWRASLPHPWRWLNQCTQARHRDFVQEMRRRSRVLLGQPWLLVHDAWQAFLLDRAVLADLDRFWADHRRQFAGVPYRPTYHLKERGELTPRWRRDWLRFRGDVRSRLPF